MQLQSPSATDIESRAHNASITRVYVCMNDSIDIDHAVACSVPSSSCRAKCRGEDVVRRTLARFANNETVLQKRISPSSSGFYFTLLTLCAILLLHPLLVLPSSAASPSAIDETASATHDPSSPTARIVTLNNCECQDTCESGSTPLMHSTIHSFRWCFTQAGCGHSSKFVNYTGDDSSTFTSALAANATSNAALAAAAGALSDDGEWWWDYCGESNANQVYVHMRPITAMNWNKLSHAVAFIGGGAFLHAEVYILYFDDASRNAPVAPSTIVGAEPGDAEAELQPPDPSLPPNPDFLAEQPKIRYKPGTRLPLRYHVTGHSDGVILDRPFFVLAEPEPLPMTDSAADLYLLKFMGHTPLTRDQIDELTRQWKHGRIYSLCYMNCRNYVDFIVTQLIPPHALSDDVRDWWDPEEAAAHQGQPDPSHRYSLTHALSTHYNFLQGTLFSYSFLSLPGWHDHLWRHVREMELDDWCNFAEKAYRKFKIISKYLGRYEEHFEPAAPQGTVHELTHPTAAP